jgi:hypothetical protein
MMPRFEFGADPPNDDDDHYDFDFTFPVVPDQVGPNIQMPTPMQPWGSLLPSESKSNASASGSGPQHQQSLVDANNHQHGIFQQLLSSSDTSFQPQQSLVDTQYHMYQQLWSNFGPEDYFASPAYHPDADESQNLGTFYPNFSLPILSVGRGVPIPTGTDYRDIARREDEEKDDEVKGTLGEVLDRKRKHPSNKPQIECISQLSQKWARLRVRDLHFVHC